MAKPLKLQSDLPKTTRLNKTAISLIVGISLFLLIFAMVNSFAPHTKTAKPVITATNQTAEKTIAPIFKELPSSYNDVAAVKKYTGLAEEKNINTLEQELGDLKNQYGSLQQQLLNNLQHVSQAPQHISNPENDQARTSGLFFSGTANEASIIKTNEGPYPASNASSAANSANPEQALGAPVTNQQAAIFSRQRNEAQKLAVMKAADNPEDIYDLHNIVKPISPYEIQAGTIIPAVLLTGLNTTLAGAIVGQIKQNMYDTVTGKYLLIPKGSKVLGEYDTRVAAGDRRVLITFNRIIRPNGSSILLGKPMAADYQGQSGIEGNIDNHWWRVLGAATLSTVLSIGAGIASDNAANNSANPTLYQNAQQGALLGAAGSVSQTGQNIVNRALDIRPVITLPPGYQFNIIVRRDMVMSPYQPDNF